MRYLTLLPALATLGLLNAAAHAQTQSVPPSTSPQTNTSAPGAPPSGTVAPSPDSPSPVASESAPTPPPYPTSPDSLVAPPGPQPPAQPTQPPPPFAAPEEPPPPQPAFYVDGREQHSGVRRPARYRYIEGTPLPEGYHLETRANRGLVFGGLATFGIPYLIGTFGTLSVLGDGNSGWLAIPIAGPWLTLANRDSSCGEIGEPSPGGFECFSHEAGNGLLIASGVLQALGTAMIAFGVANTREYAVADYAKWHITPVATPNGDYGLVVSGTL